MKVESNYKYWIKFHSETQFHIKIKKSLENMEIEVLLNKLVIFWFLNLITHSSSQGTYVSDYTLGSYQATGGWTCATYNVNVKKVFGQKLTRTFLFTTQVSF